MNHLLHNISLILIFFGIILITIYVTKSNYIKSPRQKTMPNTINDNNKMNDVDKAYAERVSKKFNSMFSDNSTWLNKYQEIDYPQVKKK